MAISESKQRLVKWEDLPMEVTRDGERGFRAYCSRWHYALCGWGVTEEEAIESARRVIQSYCNAWLPEGSSRSFEGLDFGEAGGWQ